MRKPANDLPPFYHLTKRMWEKSRPNYVRALKKDGEFEKALRSAGESAFAMESQLSEKGVPPFMARSEAIRMYIALPDIQRERPKRRRSSSSSPGRTAMNSSSPPPSAGALSRFRWSASSSVRLAKAILHVLAFVGMLSLVHLFARPLGPVLALVPFLVFFGAWLFAVIGERRSEGRLFPPEPWEID